LFATLAGLSISVAAKGLMGAMCWRESDNLGSEGWRHPLPSRDFVTI